METISKFYNRFRGVIENGIFTIILALYPLIKINQGLDVADTAYSLSNFQYFPTMQGTWMSATYLSNALGYLLMQLPYGDTLIGIYFYTGIILSATALFFYFTLRKKMTAWLVFAGEIVALNLCWCPTTILYNYLTYLFMGMGVAFLYKGICAQSNSYAGKNEDKSKDKSVDKQKYAYMCYLFIAGVLLGMNVLVRMPNVVQTAFILVLWYAAWLRKEKPLKCIKDTLVCISGYIIGFVIVFAALCLQYGIDAYPQMVNNMFAMTDKAVDYKPVSMLAGMFGDYIKGLYWLIFAGLALSFLYIVYLIIQKLSLHLFVVKVKEILFRTLCIAVFAVVIRFYWGRGMFNFEYFYYRSIYQWAVLFLIITAACAVYLLIGRNYGIEDKTLALIVLLQMFVTPLGSNNDLYPIINNLFIAAPFTIWVCGGIFSKTGGRLLHFPWKTLLVSVLLMLIVQSTGFHLNFVFQDGVWGEKRDTRLEGVAKAEGIYTNRENAELFTDLYKYAESNALTGRRVILYGELPGLGYFLDMPSAISTFWPDLDSYRLEEFEEDMKIVESGMEADSGMEKDRPIVIVSSAISAYKGEDAEAYEWFGVKPEVYEKDEKLSIILRFLDDYDYEETFCNMRYAVYE